jgi:hypothetical protein
MSKTLFNQNTFQSKNVTNSDEVQILKVDTFKATNAILTNITNAELQAATTGVASNAAALVNKQDKLTASNRLNPNFIDAENDGDPVTITTGEFGALTGFDNAGGATIQGEIDKKAQLYDVSAPLVKTARDPVGLGENPILLSINNTSSVTGGSTDLITSGGVFDALSLKQDIISSGSTLQIEVDSNEVSAILATSAGATNFGLITGNILNTELGNKQDVLTQAANAGANISISSGVISATNTNTTYTAATNGGLSLSGTAFSLNLESLTATQTLPTALEIISNTDTQLLIAPSSNTSQDARMIIRGARNASSGANHAELRFENYDNDNAASNIMASIVGRVQYTGGNYGGLLFNNFSDGSTQTTAMNMSYLGNFAIGEGDTFQDNFKLQLTGNSNFYGSSYIREGLILDPYDMPVTTFTTGDDQQSSATSLENIYIKFAPSTTTINDWAYLRQIGPYNQGRLSFDFHDDTSDVRFSIRGIHSSGQATDVITEVFDVFSSGVTAHTSIYRIPQMVFYNFTKTSMSNSRFGNENRFVAAHTTRTTGTSFSSISNGIITISSNGYYRIRVGANPVTDGYNDRLAFCVYLQIGSTDYFQSLDYNFHGYSYTRNSSDGAFSNINFEDYVYIASGRTIEVRTKLDTNNRNFDDQLTTSQMECYCNLQIERIAETDIT